jgi:hypothetical protein
MRHVWWIGMFAIASPAWAGPPRDAGLVTRLVGSATYQNATRKQPAKVTAFMKVHVGDEIATAERSEVRVEYYQGRVETWRGVASFKIGERESQLIKGAAPSVEMRDPELAHPLQHVTTLLMEAGTGRAGAGVSRGGDDGPALSADEKAQLAAAKANFEAERKKRAADDVTPELVYLVVLRDFQQWSEMKAVVADARKRVPGNAELRLLGEWLARREKAK